MKPYARATSAAACYHLVQHLRYLRRLITMLGIDAVVALTSCAAVDDQSCFRSSKRNGSLVCLTPAGNQSGQRDLSVGITKAESRQIHLRRVFCQAASVVMNRDRSTWLRIWGAHLTQRRGLKLAMAAPARRIAVILHRIRMNGIAILPGFATKMNCTRPHTRTVAY